MNLQKLGDICEFKYGKSLPEKSRKEGSYKVYGSNGAVGCHEEAITNGPTLIVGRKGSIGEVTFSHKNCWPIDTTYFVDQTCTKQNLRWMFYALKHLRLQDLNRATGVPGLNRNDAYEKELVIPSPEEQKRIAATLDQADALRQSRRRAITRLNDLSQSIFYEMFGNPMEKADTSLGDVLVSMGNGMSVPQDDTGKGVPVTRIETIWNGEIDLKRVKWSSPDMEKADRYFLNPGDILFSHINSPEHIAKTAIYEGLPKTLLHGINLLRLQPDTEKVVPLWLVTLLKTEKIRAFFRDKCKKAVNQASLNQTNLKELYFFLPSINQQYKFSERLSAVSQQLDQHNQSLEIAETLFLSLQQRAFRGDL